LRGSLGTVERAPGDDVDHARDRVRAVDRRFRRPQDLDRSTAAAGMEFRSTAAEAPTPAGTTRRPLISTRVRVDAQAAQIDARAAVGAVRRAPVVELEVRRVALLGQGLEEVADGQLCRSAGIPGG